LSDRSLYQQRFLCIDIDNFKAYLDVHGLTAGDEALRTISRELRDHFGAADVYRFGGDEFVIVLGERQVWTPNVPDEITLKHAVVDVEVQRNQRRNHYLNRLIEHFLDAGVLASKPAGIHIACTTPAWLEAIMTLRYEPPRRT
jgi:diguanylate cyclase (GGDEF)-like protein